MGGKSITERTLVFLFTATLCSEASLMYHLHLTDEMTWTQARQECQRTSADLLTWHALTTFQARFGGGVNVWIGLKRDEKQDSVWRWINLETGYGTAGEDVSSSSSWAHGESSGHCGALSAGLYWSSEKCSSLKPFYCWERNYYLNYYYPFNYTWEEALNICEKFNHSLAVIDQWNYHNFQDEGWFGLYRVGGEKWSWVQDVYSNYTNWPRFQPPAFFDCGSLHPDSGEFYSDVCTSYKQGACSADNLLVVDMWKTWEGAITHCRDMEVVCSKTTDMCGSNFDLVSLSYQSDPIYAKTKIVNATTDEVWVGLRFLEGVWWWLDGAEMEVEHQNLLPGCPLQGQHCVALSKQNGSTWLLRDCSERKNFICALLDHMV